MNGQKSVSPTVGRILYGFGGLSAMAEVAFLLQFLQQFAHLHGAALAAGATLGSILPVLVMPLCYAFVNGNTAIGTGRYHLPLVVSALLGALSFVLLSGVGGEHAVTQTFALLGACFLFSLARQVFWYAYFSIGQRFDRSGAVQKYSGGFAVCAVLAVAAAALLFADGTRDGVRAVSAIAGIVATLGVLAVYFVTVPAMPAFIRLEPYHKRSVKDTYKRFVSPLKNRAVLLFSVAAFFTSAGGAFATATLPAAVLGGMFGITRGFKPAVLVMAIAFASSGMYSLTGGGGRKTGSITLFAITGVLAAVAACAAVAVCVPLPTAVRAAVLFALAVLTGITLGFSLAGQMRGKRFAARLCGCTMGRYACLHGCIAASGIAAGVALATAVRSVLHRFGFTVAAVATVAVFAALLLAAASVQRVGQADKYWRRADEERTAPAAVMPSADSESVPAEENECSQ